jgi:hypothetical protein
VTFLYYIYHWTYDIDCTNTMCQQDDGQTIPAATEGNEPRAADFPWHMGVADARMSNSYLLPVSGCLGVEPAPKTATLLPMTPDAPIKE